MINVWGVGDGCGQINSGCGHNKWGVWSHNKWGVVMVPDDIFRKLEPIHEDGTRCGGGIDKVTIIQKTIAINISISSTFSGPSPKKRPSPEVKGRLSTCRIMKFYIEAMQYLQKK